MRKVLSKIAKFAGCEALSQWIRPCENHLYWSAMSTKDGNGAVIKAKFNSFLEHCINKHDKLKDPMFNKCVHHPDIADGKWLLEGTVNVFILLYFVAVFVLYIAL